MVRDTENFKRFAYSLLEASLVLIIVSVLVALSTNVVVSKVKSKIKNKPHGRFECYYLDKQLMQHSVVNDRDFGVQKSPTAGYCSFKPNQYVKYLVANIVGAGSPASSNAGGGAGEFQSVFFSGPANEYKLFPGKPISSTGSLTNAEILSMKSYIIKTTTLGNSYPVIVSGGVNNANISNVSPDRLNNCLVVKTNSDFDCGVAPSCVIVDSSYQSSDSSSNDTLKCSPDKNCTIKDKKIIVGYCRNKHKYKTIEYKLSDILSLNGTLLQPTAKPNIWHFYSDAFYREYECNAFPSSDDKINHSEICKDLYSIWDEAKFKSVSGKVSPCLFKLELQFDIPETNSAGEISQLTRYAKSMQFYELKAGKPDLTSGIASVSPGDGGSPSKTAGHTGGVVLLY